MNETASRALFEDDVRKISERLLTSRNWKLYSKEFPVLDVGFRGEGRTELRLRFTAANWNEAPPSVQLLDASGSFLAPNRVPQQPGGVFNQGIHPNTGHPFVCMAGTLEYHTHQSHVGDSWSNYKCKDAFTLGGIMTQLWNSWQKMTS